MNISMRNLFFMLSTIMLARLFLAWLIPYADTTEARYAEIARLMVQTGDWITPWFDEGVPFWGKPPLSFWLQALSFKLFGISEFAGRFPAWLASLGIITIIYQVGLHLHIRPFSESAKHYALIAGLIYASSTLGFISAATVMTDAFFVLGTTLTIGSFIIRLRNGSNLWSWLFFIGLVIGALSKGPLAFVISGAPILVWVIVNNAWIRLWRLLPWLRGILLAILFTLPWYVLAEIKTPGFFDYFIIGEHFKRFVISGWEGDLYGNAHDFPRGTVWLYLIIAFLPWPLLMLYRYFGSLRRGNLKPSVCKSELPDTRLILLSAILVPSVFFTFAGNILWTYVLPSLPFMALATGGLVANDSRVTSNFWTSMSLTLLMPLAFSVYGLWLGLNPDNIKSEKGLIVRAEVISEKGLENVFYVGRLPFSARFYSSNKVKSINQSTVINGLSVSPGNSIFLAVRKKDVKNLTEKGIISSALYENKRYMLFKYTLKADE